MQNILKKDEIIPFDEMFEGDNQKILQTNYYTEFQNIRNIFKEEEEYF